MTWGKNWTITNSNFVRHIDNKPADRSHNKTCYNMCRLVGPRFQSIFAAFCAKLNVFSFGFFLLSFELQKCDKSPLRLRLRSLVSCIHCSFAWVFFKGTHIPILHNSMACCRFSFFSSKPYHHLYLKLNASHGATSYVLPFRISQRCDEFDRIVSRNLPSPNNKKNVFPRRTFTFVAWVECAANWQGRFKSFHGSAEFRDRCFFSPFFQFRIKILFLFEIRKFKRKKKRSDGELESLQRVLFNAS